MCVSVVCADDETGAAASSAAAAVVVAVVVNDDDRAALLAEVLAEGGPRGGSDLNCLVFSAEMSATFKFNVASLLLLLLLTLLMPCLVCSACNKVYRGNGGGGGHTERGNLFWCVLFAGSARCAHCAVSVWLSLNFISL